MAQAIGSFARIAFADEEQWGVIPTGSDVLVRQLKALTPGESLGASMEELISRAVNDSRALENVRQGNIKVQGSLPFECSPTGLAAILKHLIGPVETEASEEPNTHVMRRGALAPGMTVEKGFTDVGKYFKFRGVRVNTGQLTIPAEGLITGSLDVIGKDLDADYTTPLGTPQQPTHKPFTSYEAAFEEGGSAITVLNTSLAIGNNLEPVPAAGNRAIVNLPEGKGDATGELTIMFENTTLFEKWAAETYSRFKVTLTQAALGSLEFYFPNIVYVGDPVPRISTDKGLVATFRFRAVKDESEQSDIVATFVNAEEEEI